MNNEIKKYLENVEIDIDDLVTGIPEKKDAGEMLESFLGWDPTTQYDWDEMYEQIGKLTNADGYKCNADERAAATDKALEHYDAIKPNVMLRVAQKTVKDMFDQDLTADDLNLDLDYLLNNEIFGTGYEEEDEEDESLLDELSEEDEIEGTEDDVDDEDENY